MANPLVATSSGGNWGVDNLSNPDYGFVGTGLFSDVEATWADASGGSPWYALALDSVNIALDGLGMIIYPFGTLIAAGIGWLIEHIGFLKKPLDYLAGDPVAVTDKEQTWKNVAQKLQGASQHYQQLAAGVAQDHQGQAADGYQATVKNFTASLDAAATHANQAAEAMKVAAVIVGTTRGVIRDTLAQFAADAIIKFIAAQALAVVTFGASEAVFVVDTVAEGVALAAENAGKIAKVTGELGHLSKSAESSQRTFDQATQHLNATTTHDTASAHSNDPVYQDWLNADRHFNGDTGGAPSAAGHGGTTPAAAGDVAAPTPAVHDTTAPSAVHDTTPNTTATSAATPPVGAPAVHTPVPTRPVPAPSSFRDFNAQAGNHSMRVTSHNAQVDAYKTRVDQHNQDVKAFERKVADNNAGTVGDLGKQGQDLATQQRALSEEGNQLTQQGQNLNKQAEDLAVQREKLQGLIENPVNQVLNQHGINTAPIAGINQKIDSALDGNRIYSVAWHIVGPGLTGANHGLNLELRGTTQGLEMQPTYEGHVAKDYANQLKNNPDPYAWPTSES